VARVKRVRPPAFEPEWTRGIAVRSLAIWAMRDDGLSPKQTIRYIVMDCGYQLCEARWAVEQARKWLNHQPPHGHSFSMLRAKDLEPLFGSAG
jgi:hypothetical protein